MRIVIETTGSEQIAIRPEEPVVASRGATSRLEAAIDGGAPHEYLLQALGERASGPPVRSAAATTEPYAVPVAGGGPSPSWH
ncbi:MAG: hypothetical protein ACREJ4_05825 [Candidatus Methylomirabilaceae bacterium]